MAGRDIFRDYVNDFGRERNFYINKIIIKLFKYNDGVRLNLFWIRV